MKSIYKISKGIVVALTSILFVTSCSEDIMDDINKDINHPSDTEAKFILAEVLIHTAFPNVGGDFNTYTATYVEHEVGVHNQLYRAEHRQNEPSASSTFNNAWESIYETLRNAKIIVEKCSEDGSQYEDLILKGIGEVMLAYNLALTTDMYGDTPWSEACDYLKNRTPKIDKQEDIYKEIMTLLDNAIVDLQGSNKSSIGSHDFMYNGNAAKWTKFAYGLKARYTMRQMKRSGNVSADMEKVVEYANKSFASPAEQAAIAIYDATNLNPLFDFQWSRDALASSESLADKLIERNDPRLRRVFVNADWEQITGDDDESWNPAPNGESGEMQYVYNTSAFVYSQTAPTLFLSYHEVQFLKAEALCRLGKTDDAETVLKNAIIAAIANMEVNVDAAMNAPTILAYGGLSETAEAVTDEEAGEYFENSVKPLFTTNPLKETMNQKYLAFFGASGESTECYNDIRRMKALGEDFIVLKNKNKFPLRCPYGNSDTTNNPNVKDAYGDGQYVYTEPVWWAGGTR
ncbi:MAG: SusD/RagB family nutrient-binding outer membrane lipoprotein [Tannerella sp.]|jgi:hypothetical protein|nr:SusD/RagB family nutrient-binding outer membrane lipoprotein [Tannerella sp.]